MEQRKLPVRGSVTNTVVDPNKIQQARSETNETPVEERFGPSNIATDTALENPTIMNEAASVVTEGITVFQSAMSKSMEEAQLELIPFVERQIELMNEKLLFDGATPTYDQLNVALLKHEGTLLGLTSLYEMKRWEKEAADSVLKEWFAIRCADMRDLVNPRDIPATKWYSSKEIEYLVIRKYQKEYAEYTAKLKLADAQVSTIQRLIDGWESYRWILQTISSNCRAETGATGVADYEEDN